MKECSLKQWKYQILNNTVTLVITYFVFIVIICSFKWGLILVTHVSFSATSDRVNEVSIDKVFFIRHRIELLFRQKFVLVKSWEVVSPIVPFRVTVPRYKEISET